MYHFGPNKPQFLGTDGEWNKLRQEIALLKDISNYPSITVICPHCGTKNTHTSNGTPEHRECDLMRDKMGKKIYDCPGYYII